MRYLVTIEAGLEPLLADELSRYGVEVLQHLDGALVCATEDRSSIERSRLARAAFTLFESGEAPSIDALRDAAGTVDWDGLSGADSFRVTASVRDASIDARELAGACGAAIQRRYGTDVKLKGFDYEAYVHVTADWWGFGTPLRDRPSAERVRRPTPLRTALKPNVAAALLQLVGADQKEGRLIDPLCGGATIPIEASHYAHLEIEASDWDEPTVAVAQEACDANGVSLAIQHADARQLGAQHPQRYDFIVTDPPYGVRQARHTGLGRLYLGLLESFAEAIRPGGRVGVVALKAKTFRRAAEATGWQIDAAVPVDLGGLKPLLFSLSRATPSTPTTASRR